MTACKDSLNGKKAVSATLAGVLAVGMVPAAAFAADQPADTTGEDGVELLAASNSQFSKADVTMVDKQAGQAVAVTGKAGQTVDKAIELSQKDGAAQYLVPTSITVADETVDLDDCTVTYFWNNTEDSTWTEVKDVNNIKDTPTSAQKRIYKMVITAGDKTGYANQTKEVYFKLKAVKAESKITAICENGNKNDTEFVYTGSSMAMSVVYKGEVVNAGDAEAGKTTAQFSFKTDATGSTYGTPAKNNTPVNAGTYTVKAQVSEGTTVVDTKEFTVTVKPIEASADIIKIADIQAKAADAVDTEAEVKAILLANTKVNGVTPNTADVTFSGAVDLTKTGAKTVTVNLAEKKDDTTKTIVNVKKSSAEVSFNVVDATVAATNFKYNGSNATAIDVDLSKGQAFDTDNFTVANSDGTVNGDATDNLTFKVKKEDGTEGTLDDLKTAGTYKVTAAIDSAALDYEQGGSQEFTVTVHNATVDTNSVYVYQDGVVKTALTADYDGTDALANVKVKVIANEGRKSEKELVEGTDYTVTVKNSDNEIVTEAVDADTYTIEIEGTTVDLKDEVKLTVNPITITAQTPTRFVTTSIKEDAAAKDKFIAYTGEAIAPQLQVNIGKDNWIDVPADAYTLSSIQYYDKDQKTFVKATEIKDKGYYKVAIKVDASHVEKNYNITGLKAIADAYDAYGNNANDANIWVADGTKFTDVLPADWYYDYVNKANDNGYVYGIGDTTTFAPNASIIRGDVAVIMYRMAGGTTANEGQTTDDKGYTTPFTDVDPHAYYAQAIQWAAKAGIISGYGDGTFKPEQNISREEFACMLAKYAKSQGKFVASDGSDLAALPDAGSVNDWAKENVAWAVEQGLMGSAGYVAPQANITRAEAAKMCVVYQPEKTSTDFQPTK